MFSILLGKDVDYDELASGKEQERFLAAQDIEQQ